MPRDCLTPILLDAHNPGPMTGRGNNTYLLLGGTSKGVLIDAGVGDPRHLAAIDQELEAGHAELARVLVTHGHRDHAAGAPFIARRHPRAGFSKFPWPEEDARYQVAWRPLDESEAVDIGGDTLAVVHTPGHSPDHIVFWHAPTRAAFVGDLVIEAASVLIDCTRGGNMNDYLASLERVMAIQPLTLFPAHGPVITDPFAVLARHIEHRRMREQQVIEALRQGHSTVPAITESIYDGLDPVLMAAAGKNVRAHLEKLKTAGLAFNIEEQWTL
jgi:glyoxylase-like metal-dependent hydrolase (beta-lactamase superfamily II)